MRRKRDTEHKNHQGRFRPRGRYLLLAVFVLLLAALFCAPLIVAKTGLRNHLAAWVFSDLDGELHIGGASFNWFSRVELRDVRVTDAEGKSLIEVARVNSEKPLLSLLANRAQLGQFQIEQATATIEIRKDGSNLEDALRELLASSDDSPSPQVTINIANGAIALKKHQSNDALELTNVNATVSIGGDTPLAVVADGVARSEEGDGRFETRLTSLPVEKGVAQQSAVEIAVLTERMPLRLFEFALLRFGTTARLTGDLDADVKIAFDPGRPSILGIRRFDARRVGIEAPVWLGKDRLTLDVVSAAGTMALADGNLELDQCSLSSDVAKFDANGTFNIDAIGTANVAAMLGDKDFRIDGEIDMGSLARMLPGVLSVKDDTRITGGKVHVNAFSRTESDKRRWVATLGTSALTADSAGRKITWDQPLRITLAAVDSAEGPVIETLSCRSDFLTATAQGTLRDGSLTASGNLDRLTDQLERFVDLSQLQLAGELSAKANWQQQPDQRVRCVGNVHLSNFALATPDSEAWQEDQLTIDADVLAAIGKSGVERLDSGQVTLKAGSDFLEIRLAGSRQLNGAKSPWPASAVLRGELASWLPRIKPWVTLPPHQSQGQINLTANGQLAGQQLHVEKAMLQLDEFQFAGSGLHVTEPQVIVHASGDLQFETLQLTLRDVTLTSSTVALRADKADMQFGDAVAMSGKVSYRYDMARLSNWIRDPTASAPLTQTSGHVTGDATVQMRDRLFSVEAAAQVHNFAYMKRKQASTGVASVALETEPWEPLWQEKLIAIEAQGNLDLARGTLNVRQAKLSGEGLALDAKGTLSELDKRCVANVTGIVDYDLAIVSKKLQSQLGPYVRFSGRERGTFTVNGPLRPLSLESDAGPLNEGRNAGGLVSSELKAETQLGWTAASVYGFTIGRGKLSAVLREGVVDFKPIIAAVGDGRMNVTPRALLNSKPATLVVERGKIVENVRITPEMSRGWLKFVAPMLANATEVQGKFSIDLAGAQFPFSDPSQGNARGTMQIHGANFGPGPMGRELLIPAQRIQALLRGQNVNSPADSQTSDWLQLPEQQVAFHLVDGRVHHENLQIVAGDVAIVTSGNVGMDQTVDLVARVPIRDEMIAGNQMLAGLKGQTLQIPVKGSLSRPLVDSRVIANVTRQVLRGAAERAVENQVQRGLEKGLQQLFGPPR